MKHAKSEKNHDLKKRRLRRAFVKRLTRGSLMRGMRRCATQDDVNDEVSAINAQGLSTAEQPVFEPELLRSANTLFWVGIALTVAGLVGVSMIDILASASVTDLVIRAILAVLLIAGPTVAFAAWQQRTTENLPETLTAEMVADANRHVRDLNEDKRAAPGGWDELISTLLIAADAGVLMFLLVPIILPAQTPIVHFLISVLSAIVMARVFKALVAGAAKGIRIGTILTQQSRLAASPAEADQRTAKKMRDEYDEAVDAHWPLRPTWWDRNRRTVTPLATLTALIVLLFGARWFVATDGIEVLGMLIVAVLLCASVAIAIRLAVAGECVTPRVLRCKRIAGKFPSVEAFHAFCVDDCRHLVARFDSAGKDLRAAIAPKTFGAASGLTITNFGEPVRTRLGTLERDRIAVKVVFPSPTSGTVRAASPPVVPAMHAPAAVAATAAVARPKPALVTPTAPATSAKPSSAPTHTAAAPKAHSSGFKPAATGTRLL